MSKRPKRLSVADELGRSRSLPDDSSQFESLGKGKTLVFLGLGPRPDLLPKMFPGTDRALYVECPDFEKQMDYEWSETIPPEWTRLKPEEFTHDLIHRATVIRYRWNLRLFPMFWGPLWAASALPHAYSSPRPEKGVIWLPGEESGLLGRELSLAFGAEGYQVRWMNPHVHEPDLAWKLTKDSPFLFFSVNFKGIDSFGEMYFLLREAGARVAVWCVDNPFHLLSGVKSRFWTELDIFVTDDWFIEPLKEMGAKNVHHLPLAASPALFKSNCLPLPPQAKGIEDRLVFVGRSEFPHKKEFFAGQSLDPQLWNDARSMLTQGIRPDFEWWCKKLGIDNPWPGKEIRAAGYGADESGKFWRTLCLRQASVPLTVFGDGNWKEILPVDADVRLPVDYYAGLPAVYAHAKACLNLTNPLLPHGLTQRHFDVWTAGGILITDRTPGLGIFPQDMVEEIAFDQPDQIREVFERLSSDITRDMIRTAWEEHIRKDHTYGKRVRRVLRTLEIPPA